MTIYFVRLIDCMLFCYLIKHTVTNFQLEQQLKELMEQKDTVQSQLDSFRRVASEGCIDECAARQRVFVPL
jgi:hypothetical protein